MTFRWPLSGWIRFRLCQKATAAQRGTQKWPEYILLFFFFFSFENVLWRWHWTSEWIWGSFTEFLSVFFCFYTKTKIMDQVCDVIWKICRYGKMLQREVKIVETIDSKELRPLRNGSPQEPPLDFLTFNFHPKNLEIFSLKDWNRIGNKTKWWNVNLNARIFSVDREGSG